MSHSNVGIHADVSEAHIDSKEENDEGIIIQVRVLETHQSLLDQSSPTVLRSGSCQYGFH